MSLSKESFVWFAVCVIGCCYQIAILTIDYAKYDITSTVELVQEQVVQLPAITWCVSLHNAMVWDHELARNSCSEILGMDCGNKSSAELTAIARTLNHASSNAAILKIPELFDGQQLMDTTIGIEQMIGLVLYLNGSNRPDTKFVTRMKDAPFLVTESVRLYYKCFTLTWRHDVQSMDSSVLRRGRYSPGVFMALVYASDLMNRTTWYEFAYSDNRIKDVRQGVVDLMVAGTESTTVSSFELFKSRLLKAPFTTNCFDYQVSHNL